MKNHELQHHHPQGRMCRDLLDQLSEFVDGTLDQKLCDEIEEHLKTCENCTVVVDSLKKTIHLYQVTARSEQMPATVRERLYKNLNLEEFLQKNQGEEKQQNKGV
jgi:anti-sigma factor (TIGR02949 family)